MTQLKDSEKLEYLLSVVQDLSMIRTLDQIMVIVRTAARRLTGADGATFVLRDFDSCYYADEDAIAPLWKGKRFPMSACISGWAMIHREAVTIRDIYADARIPADAYCPTFVKSLAMVPIRIKAPVGAIGNYWASQREIMAEELKLLQALADSTSIAMENVELYNNLERKVRERTSELESFSYSVSHDLRSPLAVISSYAELISEDPQSQFSKEGQEYFQRIQNTTFRMAKLIDALLELAKLGNKEIAKTEVNLSSIATQIADDLRVAEPNRKVEFQIQADLTAHGDPRMLRIALENLMRNAWKYSRLASPRAIIEFGSTFLGEKTAYFIRDNGVGFDMASAEGLFQAFQRFHSASEFEGIGIGLATVQRVISRHGGKVWAEAEVGKGAKFYFTLPPHLL